MLSHHLATPIWLTTQAQERISCVYSNVIQIFRQSLLPICESKKLRYLPLKGVWLANIRNSWVPQITVAWHQLDMFVYNRDPHGCCFKIAGIAEIPFQILYVGCVSHLKHDRWFDDRIYGRKNNPNLIRTIERNWKSWLPNMASDQPTVVVILCMILLKAGQ